MGAISVIPQNKSQQIGGTRVVVISLFHMPRVVQEVKTAGCGPADEGSIPSLGANMRN